MIIDSEIGSIVVASVEPDGSIVLTDDELTLLGISDVRDLRLYVASLQDVFQQDGLPQVQEPFE